MNLGSLARTPLRGGSRKRLTVGLFAGVIVLLALVVSIASLAVAASSFPDVPTTHQYYTAIIDLASRGIIGGYGNGNFGPNDEAMRQQFAKMIVGTGGYEVSEADVCYFTDVPKGGVSTLFPDNYVAVCAANGITTGTSAATFNPGGYVTRYQVISMVVRMANDLQPGLLATPPSGWTATGTWGSNATHGANAERAEYNGLLEGLNLAALTPSGNMSRGEVAQVLHNLLGILTPSGTTTTTIASTTTTTAPTTTTTTVPSGSPIATYSGSGDDVLNIQKPAGPALVWVNGNAESRFFSVTSYGPGDDGVYSYLDLVVLATEPYEGISLIDYWYYGREESTTRLVVEATGPWSIQIRPLSSARTLNPPGQVQGTGDEVVLVTGNPDTAHISGNAGSRFFCVTAYYGRTAIYDLLVLATDPYEGTVMFTKANVALIEIEASGPWSISTSP